MDLKPMSLENLFLPEIRKYSKVVLNWDIFGIKISNDKKGTLTH